MVWCSQGQLYHYANDLNKYLLAKTLQGAVYLCYFLVALSHIDKMSSSDADHRAISGTPHKESHSLGISIDPSLNAKIILIAIAFCNGLEYETQS
jgi:hypothetical protein